MTRRSLLFAAVCPPMAERPIDFEHLPEPARAIARELGLSDWAAYRQSQEARLAKRIDEGSAEHVTYYVLQSRRFTRHAPVDPVKLAATKPAALSGIAKERFSEFARSSGGDSRHRIVRDLFGHLGWTAEACFLHTMRFLADRAASDREERDRLYRRRGLSADTTPEQTQVVDRALAYLKRPPGRTLLVGPGLDLTRREGFRDEIPLRAYQVERLRKSTSELECADVRPEVLDYLGTANVCARRRDITTTCVDGQYRTAIATNVTVYLDERSLFAAFSGLARSLEPGGHFIHNDTRFAAKVFGEVLGMPAIHFEAVTLSRRQGVEMMDRAVVHRKQ
jgi:hypothetical protein